MKRLSSWMFAVTTAACVIASMPFTAGKADDEGSAIYGVKPSDENNAVFGRLQSFVPGPATNVRFMVKDTKKYASTGGWGFSQFEDGKPARDEALLKTCFSCHEPERRRDFVFTRYAP